MSQRGEVKAEMARFDSAHISVADQLDALHTALKSTQEELRRVRAEAESGRHLVDIMHDVMGNLSTEEIFHMVARRLAKALHLVDSSVILANFGDAYGIVATAFERPNDEDLEIQLDQFPEVLEALTEMEPVVIPDVSLSPLYDHLRERWVREGKIVSMQSVIAIPFTFEKNRTGVFLLRRGKEREPLSQSDVGFVNTVIRSAVSAIEQAHLIEQTRADNARLETLAHTDPLTQLLNRRALTIRLMAELERVRRYNSPLTMLMIDLDHFKMVNDTYGHLAGDELLRSIATVLQYSLRTVDMVARYGGEEFVIVLPETGEHGAVQFAERVRERIEAQDFEISPGRTIKVTVSIGVSLYPAPHVESVDDLFARADAALYRAKANGRNRVCV